MPTLEDYSELVAANARAPGNANRIRRLKEWHAELSAQGVSVDLPEFKEKQTHTATLAALAAEKASLEADIGQLTAVKNAAESAASTLSSEAAAPAARQEPAVAAEKAPVDGSLLDAIGGKLPEKAPENMFAMQDIEAHNKKRRTPHRHCQTHKPKPHTASPSIRDDHIIASYTTISLRRSTTEIAADGDTATKSLLVASKKGDIEAAKAALKAGAGLNRTDALQNTPLHLCAMKGYPELAQAILPHHGHPPYRSAL